MAISVRKFVNHSKRVLRVATKLGWLPGARYTNLRDVRSFDQLGFLDIEWQDYDFQRHLEVTKQTRPVLTVARDIERRSQLTRVIDQAHELAEYAERVVIVPKPRSLGEEINELIPGEFVLGYSVPTKYGGTRIKPEFFQRPVHLLGGRPDVQRRLGELMPVESLDCNRFTLDAAFGDYFDGEMFRPHPKGGYNRCILESVKNINRLWASYKIWRHRNGRRNGS